MLYLNVGSGSRKLTIQKIRGGNLTLGPNLDEITIGNGGTSKTSTILAYRPSYKDYHNTKLGAIFLNLEKLFPCAANSNIIVPVCSRFTQEEDGFFKGKTIAEAADGGNNMKIFGTNIKTYGFVIEDCPTLSGAHGCLPKWFQTVVMCLLPRYCL